jgi:hypothetical protein
MTIDTRHRPTVLDAVRAVESGAPLPSDGDRDALLVALQDHWSRQLLSRIDAALELGSDSPAASVAVAWRSALRDQGGVHRLLEAEAGNPALRASRRSLFSSVAVAAGLATFDDPVPARAATGERYLASVAETAEGVRRPSRLAKVLRRLWDGGPGPDPFPWAA